jgi:DeoR/GlpR family transcriptional regulator of sugar metabolism
MSQRPHSRKHLRQDRIIALLRANPTVRIAELAREFEVSTETVRRDLDELSETGAVNRTEAATYAAQHGLATPRAGGEG